MDYPVSVVSRESDISVVSDEDKEVKDDPFRTSHPTWSTRYRCLQAYICFVLSFITTLKFCLTVGRYGVVIFIPYWLFNIFYGIGSVLVEVHLGRYVMDNVARAWEMCPLTRGILWSLLMTTIFTISYDYISTCYLLKYFFSSFRKTLPWEECDPAWAKENCYQLGRKMRAISKCKKTHPTEVCANMTWEISGKQFWNERVRSLHNSTSVLWSIFNLLGAVVISFILNYKGIRGTEKLFPIFLYPTLVMWLVLTCVTFISTSALEGLISLWDFRWEYLLKIELWIDSFRDIIHYLGLGKMTLSFISSHGRFDDNILVDVLIASLGSLFVSILVTTPILSLIVDIKIHEGKTKREHLFGGIDDIFIYMSEALLLYPYPKALWSVLTYLNWYLMSASAQALSVLAITEGIQGLFKEVPNLHFWISLAVALVTFGCGLLFLFFKKLLQINSGSSIATILLLNTLTWQHSYGIWKFNKDYYFMMGRPLPIFMKGSWITIVAVPTMMLFLTVLYDWPRKPIRGVSYLYIAVPVGIYLLSMVLYMFKYYNTRSSIFDVFKANLNWGPSNPILKKSRIVFDSNTASKEMLYRQELCNRAFSKPPDIREQNIVQLM